MKRPEFIKNYKELMLGESLEEIAKFGRGEVDPDDEDQLKRYDELIEFCNGRKL